MLNVTKFMGVKCDQIEVQGRVFFLDKNGCYMDYGIWDFYNRIQLYHLGILRSTEQSSVAYFVNCDQIEVP